MTTESLRAKCIELIVALHQDERFDASERETLTEITAAIPTLFDAVNTLRADRDEWRTQHENLLAMYGREVARGALVSTLTPREFGALDSGIQALQNALLEVHRRGPWSLENARHWAGDAAFYLTDAAE